jgi:acetyl esterase/lipase
VSISLPARFWRFLLRKTFKEQRLTVAENRAQSVKNAKFMGRVPKDVAVQPVKAAGLRAVWLSPSGAEPGRVVLYLHGGGYVTSGIDSYHMLCGLLAHTLQMKILLPEYRLAPEHPFPAALDDALAAYRWLLAEGYQPSDILVAGDSAGGGLSVATVLALRDAHEPLPAAVVCLSPWTDLTFRGQSHVTQAEAEVLLKTDELRAWSAFYAGKENPANPLISPVYGDFHGFPPLFIQVGSAEILLDDARMLAAKAKSDGAQVTLKIWDGLWHVWQLLGDLIPENKPTFEEIRQFVRTQTPAPK